MDTTIRSDAVLDLHQVVAGLMMSLDSCKQLYTHYNFSDDPRCGEIETQMEASWRWTRQLPMTPQWSIEPKPLNNKITHSK